MPVTEPETDIVKGVTRHSDRQQMDHMDNGLRSVKCLSTRLSTGAPRRTLSLVIDGGPKHCRQQSIKINVSLIVPGRCQCIGQHTLNSFSILAIKRN